MINEKVASDITTDDELIVLYYLISKQVRKATKNAVHKWLQDMEIYDVNVDNAFDLLSTLGDGIVDNDTLELSTDVFRKYSANHTQIIGELESIIKVHINLSSERFVNLWDNCIFDDTMKLFIAYIVDEKMDVFGDRWMAEAQISHIKKWEEKNVLDSTLSSNYGNCLSFFVHNRFVYESDWNSHGNAREYKLCPSLKELLFSASEDVLNELKTVKDAYYFDLPF